MKAIASGIGKRVTMLTGEAGCGKTFVIIQIMKLLTSSPKSGRILVITKSDNQLDFIFERLDPKYVVRFGGFRGYRETDDNERIIKGRDLSPSGQVDRLLKRRLQLLKMVRQFAELIEYTVFEDFSCERAGYMYSSFIHPKHTEFSEFIGIEDEAKLMAKTPEDWNRYPFLNFIKQMMFPDSDECIFVEDNAENKRRVNSYWEYIKSVFEEVQEYTPLEMIREQKEREKFVMCSFAKIVGITSSFLIINNELQNYGLNYDTIIFENANTLNELEKFLSLNLQNDNTNLKRVIISGKVDECKINEINLSDESCDAIVSRNPAIHLIPIKGTVTEPIPKIYQNLDEAQFLHSVYMYLRLMGHPKFTISVLTLSEGQVELLRDMVRNHEQSWYETIGNPKVITHVDDYDGQENEVILISIAKTDFEDKERLYQMLKVALTRATKCIYCFGDFDKAFQMSPNSLHKDLQELIERLPIPEKFKIQRDGIDQPVESNKELVDILNSMLW
jgi:hypothetical protein